MEGAVCGRVSGHKVSPGGHGGEVVSVDMLALHEKRRKDGGPTLVARAYSVVLTSVPENRGAVALLAPSSCAKSWDKAIVTSRL